MNWCDVVPDRWPLYLSNSEYSTEPEGATELEEELEAAALAPGPVWKADKRVSCSRVVMDLSHRFFDTISSMSCRARLAESTVCAAKGKDEAIIPTSVYLSCFSLISAALVWRLHLRR